MNKKRIYFPSQKDSEEIFLLLRKHWIVYIPFILIAGFMALPLVAAFAYLAYAYDSLTTVAVDIIIVGGSAYLLTILGLLLFGFTDYYLDIDIITNQRIVDIEQNGLFKRKISELHLDQVQDVSASVSGFFPTLFHYGNINVQTAGERANFVFEAIVHPYRITKIILDLHEAAITKDRSVKDKLLGEARCIANHSAGSDISTAKPAVNDHSPTSARPANSPPDDIHSVIPADRQRKILEGVSRSIEDAHSSHQQPNSTRQAKSVSAPRVTHPPSEYEMKDGKVIDLD
ncbi:MAG: hypothetical protein BWY68_00210 [bacterium ADurb.Bin400]|nr:MAG: hypothetical protein BWY68_00210 [bacterium ADurb.Bin400]